MKRILESPIMPHQLEQLVHMNSEKTQFRRRAVLVKKDTNWSLIGCTIEPIDYLQPEHQKSRVHKYKFAELVEDILDVDACLAFAKSLDAKTINIEGKNINWNKIAMWDVCRVSVGNDFMAQAGHIISIDISETRNFNNEGDHLLALNEPYYPNIYEATADWLPLRKLQGDFFASDNRIGKVHFLLPELRAYFSEAAFTGINELRLVVSGTDSKKLTLMVQGAYWEGTTIHHFSEPVHNNVLTVKVPASAKRIEYFLLDAQSTVFDSYAEYLTSQHKLDRTALHISTDEAVSRIHTVSEGGEGVHVEFKPLVRIGRTNSNSKELRDKWDEIVRTVVAFANTNGGSIYFGIDDNCCIRGVNVDLQKWSREYTVNHFDDKVTPLDLYIGALRSAVIDEFSTDVEFSIWHTSINGNIVIIMDIPKAKKRPIGCTNDRNIFVRRGASNRSLTTDQITQYYATLNDLGSGNV